MNYNWQQTRAVRWMLLAALATAGCNSRSSDGYDATVQGTVTIDGELVQGGTVTFFPVATGPAAVGVVSADGSYSLRIGQGNASDLDQSKIPSGDYVAAVSVTGPTDKSQAPAGGGPLPLGPSLMADKYMVRETSELKFEIKPGMNVINLTLDGPWANPPLEEAPTEVKDGVGETEPTASGEAATPPAADAEAPADEAASDTEPEAAQPAPTTDGSSAAEGQK